MAAYFQGTRSYDAWRTAGDPALEGEADHDAESPDDDTCARCHQPLGRVSCQLGVLGDVCCSETCMHKHRNGRA
jgi:hypothetical protein